MTSGDAFIDILVGSEDRGTAAVLRVLRHVGALSHDRANDCLVFKEMRVGEEAFRHLLEKELRRR